MKNYTECKELTISVLLNPALLISFKKKSASRSIWIPIEAKLIRIHTAARSIITDEMGGKPDRIMWHFIHSLPTHRFR